MLLFFRSILIVLACAGMFAVAAQGQTPSPTPTATPTASPTPANTPRPLTPKEALANPTAETIVETTIFVYALAGGRPVLEQIRKTTIERGKTTVLNAEGRMETANYAKWIIRGPSLAKEKLRYDQEFPSVRFSLIKNEANTRLVYNDRTFDPTAEAAKAFDNQIYRGLDGLLRYKENESKIKLAGKEKILGVEYHLIDLTDKAGRKTRYYISTKRFRVMMLEYEEDGKKYTRKFYDYNYAQGTLVPFRTVLFQGDKMIEETTVGTVTFGQKVDESLFSTGS